MGARLWPVSRELSPKQLVCFFGNRTLIQNTIQRVIPVIPSDGLAVVCGKRHRYEVSRQIREMGIDPRGKVIAEPCGRNTAPAVLLAMLTLLKAGGDPVFCVFPSDHVIARVKQFHEKVASAVRLAEQGGIVTFGIPPHYPETGYGYIEGGKALGEGARRIRRFIEKPDLEEARRYVKAGNFFWNSGMFAFRASVMLDEFRTFQPGMLNAMERYVRAGFREKPALYAGMEDISIDYAIMEHTRKGVVLPSDFGWNDVGSWKSLFDHLEKDENNNILNGNIIAQKTRGCLVMAGHRLVVTNSMEDTVVVETPDSVFVSNMENSRDVKLIVNQLKQEGCQEVMQHRTRWRRWGSRTVLEESPGLYVWRLDILPGRTYTVSKKKGWQKSLTLASGSASIRKRPDPGVQQVPPRGPFLVSGRTAVQNISDKPLRLIEIGTLDQRGSRGRRS